MHPSRSLIKSAIEDLRMLLNEPTLDAKYRDDYITRTVLGRAMEEVFSRICLSEDNPVYVRATVDLVSGTEYYQLPPAVQTVVALRKSSDDQAPLTDWRPHGEMHPVGPGWALDGNTLRFNPIPSSAESWDLWYRPSANLSFQYGDEGIVEGSGSTVQDVTEFTLMGTPTLGVGGRFENEYVGQILRVLDGTKHYERVISAYDVDTQLVTVRVPMAELSVGTTVPYEIVPAGYSSFFSAVAARAALELGIGRKISSDHRQQIKESYLSALKTIRDNLSNLQGRVGKGWDKKVIDNPQDVLISAPWKLFGR